MPSIDQGKLRKYHRASRDSHAALLSASAEVRRCRENVGTAKAALERAQRPISGVVIRETERTPMGFEDVPGVQTEANDRIRQVASKSAVRDANETVKAAEAALSRAIEREDEAREAWEYAAGIWQRCRTYAEEHGALPVDLKD